MGLGFQVHCVHIKLGFPASALIRKAVISKAKVVGGQSSVVLSKNHREARKTA
jgi:hypothetical protein